MPPLAGKQKPTIDLSAGIVPMQTATTQPPLDLSAGMVEGGGAPAPSPSAMPSSGPGLLKRAWNKANEGLVSGDTIAGAATGMTREQLRSMRDDVDTATHDRWAGGKSPEDESLLERMNPVRQFKHLKAAVADPNSPEARFARSLSAGVAESASDTLSSFTSPVSLATMGLSELSQAGGAAKRLVDAGQAVSKVGRFAAAVQKPAQALSTAAAAGFGVEGAKNTAEALPGALQGNPDDVEKALQGLSMATGGVAGVGDAVNAAKPAMRLKGRYADRMSEIPFGEEFSRGDVLRAAKDKGVNLDLADATGAAGPGVVKKYAERSLGGSGTYEKNTQGNLQKMGEWAGDFLNRIYPRQMPRELTGGKVQQGLLDHLEQVKAEASREFKDLGDRIGPNAIDGTNTVEAAAKKIIADNADYYKAHPELAPKTIWKILENLATRPKIQVDVPVETPGKGFGGETTKTTKKVEQDAPQRMFSWDELHRLRSDLMEAYRNSPDLTKSKAEAWLQEMVSTIDKTMTSAEAHLSPNDRAQFRHANELWEYQKSTFDNPQHPFYHASRGQFASAVPNMVTNSTPEMVRQLRKAIGDDLYKAYVRDQVSRILDPNASGGAEGMRSVDFQQLASRLEKSNIPREYLDALLGPDMSKELRMLAHVGGKVIKNVNPSGTGSVNVAMHDVGTIGGAAAQVGAGVATGNPALIATGVATGVGAPLLQKGMAAASTSPSVVDALTSPTANQAAPRVGMTKVGKAAATAAVASNAGGPDKEEDVPEGFTRVRSHLRKRKTK